MKSRVAWVVAVVIFMLAALAPPPARASDHADPLNLSDPNANITGLFVYPEDDRYILIFNVRRSLTDAKPYDLARYEYVVNIDLTTPVAFDNAEDRARYGGTIDIPEKLHPDVTIRIQLQDDTSLKSIAYSGLKQTDQIRTYTGVRDDPFIFPRFFKTNVISMAMSIPKTAFPQDQQDFILWGVTYKNGKVFDRVGRSIRSQLPRFGVLNLVAPKDQVRVLMKTKKFLDTTYNFLNGNKEWWSQAIAGLLQFTFQIRKYDLMPDVMIYTTRFAPGFPNGRLLTDDVSAQLCATGDCLLQEISFIEGGWPRATTNDKNFLTGWPYLAAPWPDKQELVRTRSIWPYLIPVVLVTAFVIWGLVEILWRLVRRLWRAIRRKPAMAF
ncbi:MAG: DUF4331 domain-containing protein [Pseudolabrys sp.]|nr:DUF4331 domain-containing protein [Pseudolabrys sp.]